MLASLTPIEFAICSVHRVSKDIKGLFIDAVVVQTNKRTESRFVFC